MNINLKTALTTVAGVAVVGVAAHQALETHREEKAKRKQIQIDLDLDLKAIANASKIVQEKLESRDYHPGSITRLMEDLQTEIEFQKIAIRS